MSNPVISENGSKAWYVDDKLHRVDGPAVEYTAGRKEWWVDDKLHRTDGPAIEDAYGTKKWFVDGKLHRTDGPAIIFSNGEMSWWVRGVKCLTNESYQFATGISDRNMALIVLKYGNVHE